MRNEKWECRQIPGCAESSWDMVENICWERLPKTWCWLQKKCFITKLWCIQLPLWGYFFCFKYFKECLSKHKEKLNVGNIWWGEICGEDFGTYGNQYVSRILFYLLGNTAVIFTVWNNTVQYFLDFQGFILNIQKLCHCQTSSVFMPFTRIKEHLVHDLGTTAVCLPSWLCSICLGHSCFSPCLVSGTARIARKLWSPMLWKAVGVFWEAFLHNCLVLVLFVRHSQLE